MLVAHPLYYITFCLNRAPGLTFLLVVDETTEYVWIFSKKVGWVVVQVLGYRLKYTFKVCDQAGHKFAGHPASAC